MKHSWHCERIALGRAMKLWRENKPDSTLKEVAKANGVSEKRGRAIRKYLAAHGDEPCVPALADLGHYYVVNLGLAGVESVRAMLIRNHSAGIGLSKVTARLSNRDVKKLADLCALESFMHKGRRLIHWRHSL